MSEIIEGGALSAAPPSTIPCEEPREKVERDEPQRLNRSTPGAPPDGWPEPLEAAAFHGPAGDLVRIVDPHTEADPAAILLQFLVAVGNVVGRNPYFQIEATHHYLNLFAAIVGDTAKARKGTSWGHIDRLFKLIETEATDCGWSRRIASGLSSGEGLIWELRDAAGGDGDECEPAIKDKRRVVVDSELAATLKILGREGNTLSPILRNAWDSTDLRIMTKNKAARASGAHISIIAHITEDELKRELRSTEMANGFANRFLWSCARRSKLLPEGGHLRDSDLESLVLSLRTTLKSAQQVGRMERDADATDLWRAGYSQLSTAMPGTVGAITARGDAQVVRLACLYALLDHSSIIKVPHLEAALAVWTYCEASARYVFGDATGNSVADRILDAVRLAGPLGLSRTQIRDLLQRNVHKTRIEEALVLLAERGLAERRFFKNGSRETELWVVR